MADRRQATDPPESPDTDRVPGQAELPDEVEPTDRAGAKYEASAPDHLDAADQLDEARASDSGDPRAGRRGSRARRMPREARRAQLLDVASELLITNGAQAVTMERLAAWAGVSKALPYSHFENSNDVLLALRDRENARVAECLWNAGLESPVGNRAAAVVAAFFDAVENSSDLLGVLTGPGAIVVGPDEAREREGIDFVSQMLEIMFSMKDARARAIAPILLGAFIGAADGWDGGYLHRGNAEKLVLSVFRSLLAAEIRS